MKTGSALARTLAAISVSLAVAACGAGTPAATSGGAATATTAPSTAASAPAASTGAAAPAASSALSGSLTIAYWDYGPAAETNNQSIADGFMKANPGVTVKLTPVAGENWGTYYANLATQIASGNKPDMAF